MKIRRKHFIYGLTIVLLLIVCSELFSRYVLGLGSPPLSISHNKIEYLFKPDQDVYRFGNHIIINHYGMRTPQFSLDSKDEFRIMVYGDSVINGGNLTDHANLATTILQEKLSELSGKNIVIGNVSAGSWGPGNWLNYAKEYGFFDASIIILVVSSHDSTDNPTFQPLNEDTHPTKKPASALLEGLTKFFPRFIPQFAKPDNSNHPDNIIEHDTSIVEARALKDLKEFLVLAQNNSKNIIVFQYWEKEEIERGVAKPGNIHIRNTCQSVGIVPIQLYPYFHQSIQMNHNPFRDNIHPNDIGQKLIATAILESLPEHALQMARRKLK